MSEFDLRKFLSEGVVIRTKHSDFPSWVTNMIYKINAEYIEIDIGLEKNYIDNLIMVGDTMKCKYTTNDTEYTLIGWVTRINMDPPQSITIRVHQLQSFENKRDSYRYDVYLSSVVKKTNKDKKGTFAILTNVSRTGVAFLVRDSLDKLLDIDENNFNSNIFIDVYISPEKFFTLEGTLTRKCVKDRGIEYGLKIIDMGIDDEKLLYSFLEELANKDEEFYNKRSSFWSKNSGFNE